MLMGDTKRKDPNAYKKAVLTLARQPMSGVAAVQFLRMLREVGRQLECDSPEASEFLTFLRQQVRSKEDMVQL